MANYDQRTALSASLGILTPPSAPDPSVVRAWAEAIAALTLGEAGRLVHLIEKPAPGIHTLRETVSAVPHVGLVGDHPRKDYYLGKRVLGREVSAVSLDVLRILGVDPLVVGDNLVVEGLDLARLKSGNRVQVGEVVLVRSEAPHRPCSLFRERTSAEAYHVMRQGYRGALFCVAQGGTIRRGDAIQLLSG